MDNTFIWNQQLSGAKNFIEILNFEGRVTCTADNVTDDSVLDWILGFDPNCVESNDTHCSPPNIGSMLHTIGNYTFTDCVEYRGESWRLFQHSDLFAGIKSYLYETDWHIAEWNADVHVKYYWSDIDNWSSTAGSDFLTKIKYN